MAHAIHARRELRGPRALIDEADQAVEQLRHAVVLERGAKEDRVHATPRHEPPLRRGRKRPRLEVLVERRLVRHRRGLAGELGGLHAAVGEPRAKLMQNLGALLWASALGQEVRLVHKDDRGDAAAGEQPPQGLGVALHPVVCAHHEQGIVKRGERALGLRAKVHVPRRVDEHEARAVVDELRLRAEDGDPAVALHRVGIQVRVAAVHAPERADAPGVVEHGLRERRLARVHVRKYADNRLPHSPLLGTKGTGDFVPTSRPAPCHFPAPARRAPSPGPSCPSFRRDPHLN